MDHVKVGAVDGPSETVVKKAKKDIRSICYLCRLPLLAACLDSSASTSDAFIPKI